MDNKSDVFVDFFFFFYFYQHEAQLAIAPNIDFAVLFVRTTGVFLAVQHRHMLNSL